MAELDLQLEDIIDDDADQVLGQWYDDTAYEEESTAPVAAGDEWTKAITMDLQWLERCSYCEGAWWSCIGWYRVRLSTSCKAAGNTETKPVVCWDMYWLDGVGQCEMWLQH